MPTGLGSLGVAAASNGKIYAIGGATVEEYDPVADTWTTKASMPIARDYPGVAAASNGKIYAIGGVGQSGGLATVEEYDPTTDTWTTKANMPTARYFLGIAAARNGNIYAIGGDNNSGYFLGTVEEYTPPAWGGIAEVNTNPQWLDAMHYRASYDFSVLNPKSSYQVDIEGIAGSDGVLIAPDTRTSFTVDYAGEISDTTPPPAPHVLAWGNGSLTQLTARAWASDAQSAITGYRYAIGTTPGGTDVVNWTNTASPDITRTGLLLQPGQTYFISFKARNAAGLWSPPGVSNAVINGKAMLLYLLVIRH
jgi:hypothetical protein